MARHSYASFASQAVTRKYYIVLYCIVLYCIVLYCIVLYCIMRPYTDGRLDRYRIGISRELTEIRTQPWLSEDL